MLMTNATKCNALCRFSTKMIHTSFHLSKKKKKTAVISCSFFQICKCKRTYNSVGGFFFAYQKCETRHVPFFLNGIFRIFSQAGVHHIKECAICTLYIALCISMSNRFYWFYFAGHFLESIYLFTHIVFKIFFFCADQVKLIVITCYRIIT